MLLRSTLSCIFRSYLLLRLTHLDFFFKETSLLVRSFTNIRKRLEYLEEFSALQQFSELATGSDVYQLFKCVVHFVAALMKSSCKLLKPVH